MSRRLESENSETELRTSQFDLPLPDIGNFTFTGLNDESKELKLDRAWHVSRGRRPSRLVPSVIYATVRALRGVLVTIRLWIVIAMAVVAMLTGAMLIRDAIFAVIGLMQVTVGKGMTFFFTVHRELSTDILSGYRENKAADKI